MQQIPETKRHISVRTASAFVVASMIGTGVFTSLGFQLVEIQAVFPLIMLWVIGGVVALLGALTYSELAVALPRSGGEYHLLSRIIHPALGFVGGLVSATVGFSAPAVLAAMALGSYLAAVFPSLEPMWVAALCILFFHALHGYNLNWGKLFQDWSTVVKVGLILLFIAAGLLTAEAQTISLLPQAGDGQLLRSSGFAVSLVWVSYAYTGWNSTVYIAGEMIHPKRDIPRSILLSTIFVMVLYVLLNFVFLYTTPRTAMVGEIEIGYIAGQYVFGAAGSRIFALGISILLVSTVSSYVYIGPRIMQTMGQDYSYIGFLSKTNDQSIPVNAFLLQLLICLAFIFSSSFEQVLLYAGIVLIFTTTITTAAVFVLRYKEPDLARPYKTWGYPWTPLLFILVNLWILYYTFWAKPLESSIGIGIMVLSLGLYYVGKNYLKIAGKE
jgi:APA family basic amino acid/polyamine antiporter